MKIPSLEGRLAQVLVVSKETAGDFLSIAIPHLHIAELLENWKKESQRIKTRNKKMKIL